MGEYIVSARKYRPMTFESVVGQSALTTTLKNAVKTGKVAHAYLFCGPRGVGKTTCARIFAKAINCENPSGDGEACNECESCKAFNEGRSLNIFELDAASNNSVDDIRALIEQTRVPPQVGRYKVFIIDEVHMLSSSAANAFLKTLEEPPSYVIFILATTEKQKILPTIISRCQIYDFQRMTVEEIIEQLKMIATKENIGFEDRALDVIAEKADGGMRDALSIFDQAASFSQGNITYDKVIENLNVLDSNYYFRIVDLALENKVADIMPLLNGLISKGFDGGGIINGLARHMRNVMMAHDAQTLPLLEVSEAQRKRYAEQARKCPLKFLYKALEIMNRCDLSYRQSSNKRLLVELTLIEVAQITQADDTEPGAGRSPKRLKILFKKNVVPQQSAASQVAAEEKPVVRTTRATIRREETTHVKSPAVSTSAPQGRLNLGKLTQSFSDMLHDDKPKVEEEADTPATTEVQKFTNTDLSREWMSMCLRMEGTPLIGLAQRMKNLSPTITVYPNAEVVVDNGILLEQMNNIKLRLEKTLKVYLKNSDLHLALRQATKKEQKPILNNAQILEKLKQRNPSLARLAATLGLEAIG